MSSSDDEHVDATLQLLNKYDLIKPIEDAIVRELTQHPVDLKALFTKYAAEHGIQNTSLQALIAIVNGEIQLGAHVRESLIDKVLQAIKRAEDMERLTSFQNFDA